MNESLAQNDAAIPLCEGCDGPVKTGQPAIRAMGNVFHSQCFRCNKCSVTLTGPFIVKGDRALCKQCATGRKCATCLAVIANEAFIELDGEFLHERCAPADIVIYK